MKIPKQFEAPVLSSPEDWYKFHTAELEKAGDDLTALQQVSREANTVMVRNVSYMTPKGISGAELADYKQRCELNRGSFETFLKPLTFIAEAKFCAEVSVLSDKVQKETLKTFAKLEKDAQKIAQELEALVEKQRDLIYQTGRTKAMSQHGHSAPANVKNFWTPFGILNNSGQYTTKEVAQEFGGAVVNRALK